MNTIFNFILFLLFIVGTPTYGITKYDYLLTIDAKGKISVSSYFPEGFGVLVEKQVLLSKGDDGKYYIRDKNKRYYAPTHIHHSFKHKKAADIFLSDKNEVEVTVIGYETFDGIGTPKSQVSIAEADEFYTIANINRWKFDCYFVIIDIQSVNNLNNATNLNFGCKIKTFAPLYHEGFGVIIKKRAYIKKINETLYISSDETFSHYSQLELDDHSFSPCERPSDESKIRKSLERKSMVYVDIIGYEYILGYGYDLLKKEMNDTQHIFFASHAEIIE